MVYNHKKSMPTPPPRRSVRRRENGPVIRLRHVFSLLGAIAVCSILLFVFILIYSGITQYRGFSANKVTVFGTKRLTDPEILAQADVQNGVNIFRINLDVVRQRLLAHPWIHSAEVTREIPGSITIRVREHEPQAIVEMNKRYLMNTEGDVFKHFSGESDLSPVSTGDGEAEGPDQGYHEGYPLITGFSPEDIQVAGSPIMKNETNPHKAVMNIIQLAKVPDSSLPLSQIKQILVDREIGLTLLTSGSIRTVKLGYGDYGEKVRRLGEVSKFLKEKARLQEIDTLDLHNLERIVVKPASGRKTA